MIIEITEFNWVLSKINAQFFFSTNIYYKYNCRSLYKKRETAHEAATQSKQLCETIVEKHCSNMLYINKKLSMIRKTKWLLLCCDHTLLLTHFMAALEALTMFF